MKYLAINLYENPRILYKYFPLSKDFAVRQKKDEKMLGLTFTPNLKREEASQVGEVVDKWKLIALDGYIFYTSPQFFNDPFDTPLPNAPEIVPTIDERRSILAEFSSVLKLKREETDRLIFSDNFDRALGIVLEGRISDHYLCEKLLKTIKMGKIAYKEQIAIACFSEINNSKLMWAHYAGSYSGFCIEYDFSKSNDKSFLKGIAKVQYTDDMPRIEQYDDYGEYKSEIILTKAECWTYEREWRSRKIADYSMWKLQIYPIIGASNYMTSIYLGCNMPVDYQNLIINHYQSSDVKVYRMKLCDDKFDMYFEQC